MKRSRARSLGFWAGLSLLSSGCNAGLGFLPLPDLAGAQTVVLAVESSGARQAVAYPADGVGTLHLSNGSAYVIAFDSTLEVLELPPGPIESRAGAPCIRLLPTRVLSASFGREPVWSPASMPDWLAELLVADRARRCVPCVDFEVRIAALPDPGTSGRSRDVKTIAWLDSGRALATTNSRNAFIMDPGSATQIEDCGDLGALEQMLPVGENRFWAVGSQGRLLELSIDEEAPSCEVHTSTSTALSGNAALFRWVAGPGLGDPDGELFLLSNRGELFRFDDRGFEHLTTVPFRPQQNGDDEGTVDGGLVWLGPGEVAFNLGYDSVFFWKRGRQTEEVLTLPINTTGFIIDFDQVPGFGLLAGATNGQVYRRKDRDAWVPLPEPPEGASVAVGGMTRFGEDRLVLVQAAGAVSQYTELWGYCEHPLQIQGAQDSGSMTIGRTEAVAITNLFTPQARAPEAVVWLLPP